MLKAPTRSPFAFEGKHGVVTSVQGATLVVQLDPEPLATVDDQGEPLIIETAGETLAVPEDYVTLEK